MNVNNKELCNKIRQILLGSGLPVSEWEVREGNSHIPRADVHTSSPVVKSYVVGRLIDEGYKIDVWGFSFGFAIRMAESKTLNDEIKEALEESRGREELLLELRKANARASYWKDMEELRRRQVSFDAARADAYFSFDRLMEMNEEMKILRERHRKNCEELESLGITNPLKPDLSFSGKSSSEVGRETHERRNPDFSGNGVF
jgi:hypothetical protein